jgi:hypothetical protein
MAEGNFIWSSLAEWIGSFPNGNPVRFEDLNTKNILYVFETSWVNPDTQENTQVFQLEYLEGGGSNVELTSTTYYFPTLGQDLDDFKAWLDATSSLNNVVTYTDLFAVGFVDKTVTTRDVLVNDDRVVRRIFNDAGDYTALHLNAGQSVSYLKLFVADDQTKAYTSYYSYE